MVNALPLISKAGDVCVDCLAMFIPIFLSKWARRLQPKSAVFGCEMNRPVVAQQQEQRSFLIVQPNVVLVKRASVPVHGAALNPFDGNRVSEKPQPTASRIGWGSLHFMELYKSVADARGFFCSEPRLAVNPPAASCTSPLLRDGCATPAHVAGWLAAARMLAGARRHTRAITSSASRIYNTNASPLAKRAKKNLQGFAAPRLFLRIPWKIFKNESHSAAYIFSFAFLGSSAGRGRLPPRPGKAYFACVGPTENIGEQLTFCNEKDLNTYQGRFSGGPHGRFPVFGMPANRRKPRVPGARSDLRRLLDLPLHLSV